MQKVKGTEQQNVSWVGSWSVFFFFTDFTFLLLCVQQRDQDSIKLKHAADRTCLLSQGF
jgi:hypothetical protein